MNNTVIVFYAVSFVLLLGVVTAFVVMVTSLIATIVRWKTSNRGRQAFRGLVAFAAIPCLIGVQQSIQWFVFLPALGRQQVAEMNAAREQRLVTTSVVQLGDPVPQFNLTTVDGDEFSLPESGDVVLLNFFATWCGPCQIELPYIEQLWTKNKNNEHFRLLVIGREETTETVREHRDKNGFSFPIAADPDRAVYSLFAKESIPRTMIVSPDGRIVYSKAGFYEDDLDELEAVLREQFANLR